jgi:hypothetical protein
MCGELYGCHVMGMSKILRMPALVIQCAVVLLSFSVFLLALGIPTPSLLSLLVSNDILEEASTFEGLSLPTSVYDRLQFSASAAVEAIYAFERRTFDRSLLRPPIL